MRRQIIFISIVFGILCAFLGSAFAADKLPVFVSIAPQKYIVKQIGQELIDVQVMVHPGADPHTYEPKPRQMVAIAKTKLYFSVGIEFEKANLSRITTTNPNLKVIHTDHNIDKLAMVALHHHDAHEEENHENDHHEADNNREKGEHHEDAELGKDHRKHTGLDPHIWLSPPLVRSKLAPFWPRCKRLIQCIGTSMKPTSRNLQPV
jgi:zinc transport system substrate-binding protein